MTLFWFLAGFATAFWVCVIVPYIRAVWCGWQDAKRENAAEVARENERRRLAREEAIADTRLTWRDRQKIEAAIEDSRLGRERWSA